MRKTSQDGGDTTSITSGIENEVKKSTTGIAKIKRNSIKKKVQNFSLESDDGVIEPLLQKNNEKTEFPSQSAKFSLLKTKTDVASVKMDDKDKLLPDNKVEKLPLASFSGVSENLISKEGYKSSSCTVGTIYNHMNTNVFSNSDNMKIGVVPKSQILVEIDGNKQGGYSSGPLIFTTAKIHTNGKTMQMEPVQVTPVPILSTIEGSIVKTSSVDDNQKVNIGTLGKSSSILNTDVRKDSEEMNSVDVNFKTTTGIISCSKPGPSCSRLAGSPEFPKVSSDDKKPLSNSFKSKHLPTSSVTISDGNVISTAASKIIVPTMTKQAEGITSDKRTKDVPKEQVSDKKSTIVNQQEIDVNKNFQLPTCSTLPINNSVIDLKDVAGKGIKDLSNIKLLQRQTIAADDLHSKTDTKKKCIIHETEKKSSISMTYKSAADNVAKNEVSKIPGILNASTSIKPSLTVTQDTILKPVPVTTSVTKTHQLTDELITTISGTMPLKTVTSSVPTNVTHMTSTTKKPNVKTTTIIDSAVEKMTTSTLSSASFTNPTVAVNPITSVSKFSVDTKPISSYKTASKSVIPASNVKIESGAVSTGKPTTKSIPSKSTTSGETLSGNKSLPTGTSTFASTSSKTPLIGSQPKNVSATVPIQQSSNNIVKSNSVVPNKLNTSKDQVTATSSKIRIPITRSVNTGPSSTKPTSSVAVKTQQNSRQQPVTSTNLSETTVKTVNAIKKPSTSAVSSKVSQATNVGVTSDGQIVSAKASVKSSPSTVSPTNVVTTTSPNPLSINKSIDLRSNEHKKDK